MAGWSFGARAEELKESASSSLATHSLEQSFARPTPTGTEIARFGSWQSQTAQVSRLRTGSGGYDRPLERRGRFSVLLAELGREMAVARKAEVERQPR